MKKNIGSSIGMKLLAFMLRVFGLRVAYLFALFPVVWYYLVKPDGRRSAAILHRALGLKGGAVKRFFFGFRQAAEYSKIIMDNLYLGAFGGDKFSIEESGTDLLLEELKKGHGLILVSAHVGNWHLAVNFFTQTQTHVHLVINDVRQEEVQRQMDKAKDMSAHLTVQSAKEGPALVFELSAALKRGEVVIIAGDRAPTTGRRTKIPFLGQEAWFPTAAFSLAESVGAPVCTTLIFRTGIRKYRCFGLGPFTAPDDTKNRKERTDAMASAFVQTLEKQVRQYPTQWFNFFDFWRDPE